MSKEKVKLQKGNGKVSAPELEATPLYYYEIETQIKYLQGRILTIVDASVGGGQNRAVKDLVNTEFRQTLVHFFENCHKDCHELTDRELMDIDDIQGDHIVQKPEIHPEVK